VDIGTNAVAVSDFMMQIHNWKAWSQRQCKKPRSRPKPEVVITSALN